MDVMTVEPTGAMVGTLRDVLRLCGIEITAAQARASLTAALMVGCGEGTISASLGVITAAEFRDAQQDPQVVALLEKAKPHDA